MSTGLAKADDQWEFIEGDDRRTLSEWKLTMRKSPGRSRRIGCEVVNNGSRFVTEAFAVGYWESKFDDQGPPANGEFLLQLIDSGFTEISRLRITVDQLDPTQLRELLRLEATVNRNPGQPYFEGLEVMVSSCLSAQQRLRRKEKTGDVRQRKGVYNQPRTKDNKQG